MFMSGCLFMDFRSNMMPAWYWIFYFRLTLCNLSACGSLALVMTLSSQCQSHSHLRWNWSERFNWKGLLQESSHFVRITSHGLFRRKRKGCLLGVGLRISFEFSTHEIWKSAPVPYNRSYVKMPQLSGKWWYKAGINKYSARCLHIISIPKTFSSLFYFHFLGMLYNSIFTLTHLMNNLMKQWLICHLGFFLLTIIC